MSVRGVECLGNARLLVASDPHEDQARAHSAVKRLPGGMRR